jgi:predicted O-methyltransferase YrrM
MANTEAVLIGGRPIRYCQLQVLIAITQPTSIIEVGTNRGDGGLRMCEEALKYRSHVTYTGFDVFDSKDEQFHRDALNGKGAFGRDFVADRFEALRRRHAGFSYQLIQGLTSATLHGKSLKADFVFIDGDHRVETVKQDFQALRHSKLIVLDDYYDSALEPGRSLTKRFGCNQLVERLEGARVLPLADCFPETGRIWMAFYRPRPQFWERIKRYF